MSEDAMALLWTVTAIWIGLPLHVIAAIQASRAYLENSRAG